MHVRAPGKVNLFLEVGRVLPDGYHALATAFQAVSLCEDIWATPAEGFSVSVRGPVDVSGVPRDDRNLAVRAARLLAAKTGYAGGVHLEIHKAVPVAGGMGGGSADAAAALVACDALWDTHLTSAQLHALAARLGADVPFALRGGTAVGTGRGDELSSALARGRFDWVFVTASEGLSTPEVYGALDRHRERHRFDIEPSAAGPRVEPDVLHALRAGDPAALAAALRNDLQVAALALRPDLADVLVSGERAGALAGIVSGSGPTLAFLCADEAAAADVAGSLAADGFDAHVAYGAVPGARVVTG
ncbi:4-(cytidine 5'-diphospho)-2-C-methyl-D-erythritol kinase [Microbacterium sp. LRZ72]|uniref:4-(cytidine 5'-diphospho)-2-C-methyl-D-erythritol kinase n=1 Tax=Microbacterium sp. LRZ72 TaxID=2942481 RepID=UPI0029B21EB8|nr:4-(cytidine 5'-diphospho)-2-C-methyl-D-erythritol kinase [Microbacterium sp. LRZ72]MDX2375856.1 4-(cytidine 5'-diphospho)-2-C-methyl-D-erythritol kinase [Microbacterium sp. LRZ72]